MSKSFNKKVNTSNNPLPVIMYSTNNSFYSHIIKTLYQYYYSFIKPTPPFTGTFMEFGRFVWIHNEAAISQLYTSGFFGKGDLSRSEPTWLDRNLRQNTKSLEEITVERRRKRRNQASLEAVATNDDLLKPNEILEMTDNKNIESFQLDLYEAFFLIFATNSLSIQDTNQQCLSIHDCWSIFCKCNQLFHVNYAVYHYYRSLGWVPKTGSKFGVDFVLYQSGPKFRHADYAVTVIPLYNGKAMEKEKSWDWLLRLNRICTQVKKTLILCYVSLPHDTSTCTDLNEYTIRQVIYKRWSPQKNRE